MKAELKRWTVQDAKARFCELLETCAREGPQIVTEHGVEHAVVVSVASRPTLKALLLAPEPRLTLEIPQRGARRRRPPQALA